MFIIIYDITALLSTQECTSIRQSYNVHSCMIAVQMVKTNKQKVFIINFSENTKKPFLYLCLWVGKIPFNIGICCTRGEILKQFLHVHINLIYFKLNQRRSFALCNPIYCQKLIMFCLCHIKLGFILKKKVESVMPCVWQGRIYTSLVMDLGNVQFGLYTGTWSAKSVNIVYILSCQPKKHMFNWSVNSNVFILKTKVESVTPCVMGRRNVQFRLYKEQGRTRRCISPTRSNEDERISIQVRILIFDLYGLFSL